MYNIHKLHNVSITKREVYIEMQYDQTALIEKLNDPKNCEQSTTQIEKNAMDFFFRFNILNCCLA